MSARRGAGARATSKFLGIQLQDWRFAIRTRGCECRFVRSHGNINGNARKQPCNIATLSKGARGGLGGDGTDLDHPLEDFCFRVLVQNGRNLHHEHGV